ncbi:MAG: gluconeogenesis factor YvcK family protein [Anaerolineae bacterium]
MSSSVLKPVTKRWRSLRKWLAPGLGVKRWLLLLLIGVAAVSIAIAQALVIVYNAAGSSDLIRLLTLAFLPLEWRILIALLIGGAALIVALRELNRSFLTPLARSDPNKRAELVDVLYRNARLGHGIRLVALGGGTGSFLRSAWHVKAETSQITAVVTMADDGGVSGKLRRDRVLLPGDVRNNIAALADDEDLMTQLFQYRFAEGGLEGHSFGNLFLTALANITGSMDKAIVEAGRVLAIEGRVLPSTMQDVSLGAEIRKPDGSVIHVSGESQITEMGADTNGRIERVFLEPNRARAYPDSIRALLGADMIVIGPGSLYTSILPNLLVDGMAEAIRVSNASVKVYICNIATQRGETDNFNVADHVLAIEKHIGRGVFTIVLANNAYPEQNAGPNTRYVPATPADHDIRTRYELVEADLTDPQRPWRHSPDKLGQQLIQLWAAHRHSESIGK